VKALCQGRIVWTRIVGKDGKPKNRPVVILTGNREIQSAEVLEVVVCSNSAALVNPRPSQCLEIPHSPEGHSLTLLRKPTVAVCDWRDEIPNKSYRQEDLGGIVYPALLKSIFDKIRELENAKAVKKPATARALPVSKVLAKISHHATSIAIAAKKTTLVVCTCNSCRSQMAEGFIRHYSQDNLNVFSAGTEPATEVHPLAIRVMAEAGIDISNHKTKHINSFSEQPIDHLLTVCENAAQACPRGIATNGTHEHWPIDDPAVVDGSEAERLVVFRRVRDEIRASVEAMSTGST
jgi:arsenate reductase